MRSNTLCLFILFLITSIATQLALADIPTYGKTQLDIIINPQNPTFTIAFDFEPSCGADWQLHAYDSALLTLIKYDFKPYDSAHPRAKGLLSWTFKVLPAAFVTNNTATTLSIQYGYHWSTHLGETLTYHIRTIQ